MGKNSKTTSGFSIAEAMVTILIVSVALAAMAPMLSKRNINTQSGNSKWMYTRNGADITRVSGNVGVGIPVNNNPAAKLDIQGAGGTVVRINAPSKNQRAISINASGAETGWVNADGNSSFGVPSGMVAFFARNDGCPTGWTNLTEWGWGGMYFRVADGSNPYNVYQDSQNKWHTHQFRNQMTWDNMNYRNQTIGRGDAGDLLGPYYNEQAIVPEGGSEARPRTIPLYGCVKN